MQLKPKPKDVGEVAEVKPNKVATEADADVNTNKKPKDGENTVSWFRRTAGDMAGPVKFLVVVALVITGIAFLPGLLMKQMGDQLFPFIPEEYRPAAMAGACCCSCCSCVCVVCLALFMALKN